MYAKGKRGWGRMRDVYIKYTHDEIIFLFAYCSLALLLLLQCSATDLEMDDLDECDQVTQVIGYHPHYRDHFLRTQNFIMKGDGPLPYAYRYYLAIIVSTYILHKQTYTSISCSSL